MLKKCLTIKDLGSLKLAFASRVFRSRPESERGAGLSLPKSVIIRKILIIKLATQPEVQSDRIPLIGPSASLKAL